MTCFRKHPNPNICEVIFVCWWQRGTKPLSFFREVGRQVNPNLLKKYFNEIRIPEIPGFLHNTPSKTPVKCQPMRIWMAAKCLGRKVVQGDCVSSLGIEFEVIEVPGHTIDHISFYNRENNILFCGDTLFAGGCGRVFEGTCETTLIQEEKKDVFLHPPLYLRYKSPRQL